MENELEQISYIMKLYEQLKDTEIFKQYYEEDFQIKLENLQMLSGLMGRMCTK